MKKLLLIWTLLGACLLSSCGGGSLFSNEKEDAYEIISYYNTALDVTKNVYRQNEFERALTYMQKRGKNSITPHFFPVVNIDTASMRTPSKAFDAEVRKELTEKFDEYYSAGNRFKGNVGAFEKYLKTEDYKDDNWAKGNALYEENLALAERMSELKREILAIITPLADEAEMKTLDDNALKEYIIASKGIFAAMDDVQLLLLEDKVDGEAIDAKYAEIEELIAKARAITPVENYESEIKKYETFLTKVEDFLGELRKIRRNGRYTEREWDSLDGKYDNAIDAYNRFVS